MGETLEILEKAAKGLLPEYIHGGVDIDIESFSDLRARGYISATDITDDKGLEFTSPKITDLGRIYLNSQEMKYYKDYLS